MSDNTRRNKDDEGDLHLQARTDTTQTTVSHGRDAEKDARLDGYDEQGTKERQDSGKNDTTEDKDNGRDQNDSGKNTEGTDKDDEKQPEGGYDATPVPRAPPGWTVKITIHRATNLPMADINSLSSDPWVLMQINTALPRRHKGDPLLRMRTPTVRRNTDPEWNFEWIVGNIPSSGFKLKARVYDEDPGDHDDRLGNVHVNVSNLDENWKGFTEEPCKIAKRSGSKRAYAIRAMAACMSKAKSLHGDLYISMELLGRTQVENGGHVFTIGPTWSIRHFSPMLGRLAGRKEPSDDEEEEEGGQASPEKKKKKKKKTQRYNFQANQFQLEGPVPDELYHRYVEFRPFVKAMFTATGVRGWVLSKALHHQHARVYNFDRYTKWKHFPEGPSNDMTRAFLDVVHYDQGGRIFTYVLSLDALLRFTETGKEFGIDMLSKHTMHSDVSTYIAFSGEFFIRRLKHSHRPPPPDPVEDVSQDHSGQNHEENPQHPPDDLSGGPPEDDPPKDPAYYELVIDNDSGTYRPNPEKLPLLKKFLAHNFPGLHILTLDCQADADKMAKMKQAQRDRKKREGDGIIYAQDGGSRASSISSSDEELLDDLEAVHEDDDDDDGASVVPGLAHHIKRDAAYRGKALAESWKKNVPGQDSERKKQGE